MSQPATDQAASITGYTRQHWEQLADQLLFSVRQFASPTHALLRPPGPVSWSGAWSDGLEGFARTFLLAGFRVGGAGGEDPHGFLDRYAEGLAAGTDPASPERWPTLLEVPQARVEAASIVIALHETRPWLWDRLDDSTRQRVVDWLAAFVGTRGYENNWVWFQNISEAFLRTVGGPWSADDVERNLALHESWYVGDGWYSDGASIDGRLAYFDYYCGWALHFYPLWYHRVLGEAAPVTYRDRLRQYLAHAQHLVSADAAPVFHGRSLIYRFAMLAPFWAGAAFDATPLSAGQTRRLTSGVLRHFVDHGAVDGAGLLPIGWHGAYSPMRQIYSGGGSPYWASKGFAGLVLPPEHPTWTEPEEPLAVETSDVTVSLPQPGWLISGTVADGVVRLVNHGGDHRPNRPSNPDDPFYARHAYSSHTGPELGAASCLEPADSHVALVDTAGRLSHRGRIERVVQGEAFAVSRCRTLWVAGRDDSMTSALWPAFLTGPWLTTASLLRGAVEVRLARIDGHLADEDDPDAHWPSSVGPWRLHLGGWALAGDDPPHSSDDGANAQARRHDGLLSAVHGLRGLDSAGVAASEDTSAFGRYSAIPWLRTSVTVEPGELFAAAVVLTAQDAPYIVVDRVDYEPGPDVDRAIIHWADGRVDTVPLDG